MVCVQTPWVDATRCWHSAASFMGAKPNVSKQPLWRVMAQCCWAGQQDLARRWLPQRPWLPHVDVGSWPPPIGSFCLSGAEHSQTHLKDRFGGSLNTKSLLGPDCSETPPQNLLELCQPLVFSLVNAIHPPLQLPNLGWGFLMRLPGTARCSTAGGSGLGSPPA